MLRITIHNEETATSLVIEGKLGGLGVDELKRCWQQVTSSQAPGSVLVNLTDMTGIDFAGKELLNQLHRQGGKLVGTGVMTEVLIEEIVNAR